MGLFFFFFFLSKIKLAYLLPLANIGLFKWNNLTVTSFSPFNNRVIYLDFVFNGSIFQHLKVSRHIISASTHFYMHFGVQVSSLMALISIHQSFHFKTAHLIFKYFICFCVWRSLSSLPSPSPSQFINLAMAKTRFVF